MELTSQDREAITSYIRHYASNTYYCGPLDLDNVSLRYWREAKEQYLYPLLGNELHISKPIQLSVSRGEKVAKINKLALTAHPFVQSLRECLGVDAREQRSDDAFATFPEWYSPLLNSFSWATTLASGTYNGEAYSFTLREQPFHLHKNERITKLGRKLAKIYNLQSDFEDFRIQLSKVTGEKVRDGVLHLSIHPLDFATMSDNNNGWTSCMRWREDPGCYREGTLDCMNSPYALLAYLEDADHPMPLPDGHSWNNKVWRELFIVHPEWGIMGIKGYPYANAALESETVSWLRSLAEENLDWGFVNEVPVPYTYPRGWMVGEHTYTANFTWNYMYDDTFSANTYHYACLLDGAQLQNNYFYFSGTVRCIICGDYLPDSEGDGMGVVCCQEHAGHATCWNCGDWLRPSDDYETLGNGECVCQYCWDNHAIWCPAQEEYCWDDDTVEVALVEDGCEYGDEQWPTITCSYDYISHLPPREFAVRQAHRTGYRDYYLYVSEVIDENTRGLW